MPLRIKRLDPWGVAGTLASKRYYGPTNRGKGEARRGFVGPFSYKEHEKGAWLSLLRSGQTPDGITLLLLAGQAINHLHRYEQRQRYYGRICHSGFSFRRAFGRCRYPRPVRP